MTNQHPIAPPPELVQEWLEKADTFRYFVKSVHQYVATRAAQWGADQELAACCEWTQGYAECGDSLRAARRPKPPSLKEQGLTALKLLKQRTTDPSIIEPLSQAVEQLDD